jgi:hypothetical protein
MQASLKIEFIEQADESLCERRHPQAARDARTHGITREHNTHDTRETRQTQHTAASCRFDDGHPGGAHGKSDTVSAASLVRLWLSLRVHARGTDSTTGRGENGTIMQLGGLAASIVRMACTGQSLMCVELRGSASRFKGLRALEEK